MYQIIKNVIERGGYDLTVILQKIKILWVNGSITDEQYDELLGLARGGAQTKDSVDIIERLNDLESRVRALESNTQTETPTEEYPEFVVGKWYYNGDKCSFSGKNYTCIAPTGTVCVWSPIDYPAYWKEV